MCKLGESSARLEALGVRVRLVDRLTEGALYFRKRAIAILDESLDQDYADGLLDGISDEIESDREWAVSLQASLSEPA
jgi:hypothetical protein